MPNQNQKITWEAPEFRYYEKNIGWYITVLAITILLIGFFIVLEADYFASITVAVAAMVIIYFSNHKPGTIVNEINAKGIVVGNIYFPYKQLKHFWIVNTEDHRSINFVTNTVISREVIMELSDQDPEAIREFLLPRLPENDSNEASITQKISRMLKF